MHKFFLYISAFVFLSSATEIHQLARLPQLLQHFRQHRQEDPSLSLLGFLQMHYTDPHPNDQDDDNDQELPFKTGGEIYHIDTPVFGAARIETAAPFTERDKIIVLHPEGRPRNLSFPVFHPPQFG